ncbi:MAG: AraC family transcriptional regulator [Bacteroidota bacterium]
MKDFYKYLQVNREHPYRDLVVVNAGHTCIGPGTSYPPENHPSHHNFSYRKGRVIDEYQLVYISSGKGVLETLHGGRFDITSGDGFLLFPGEWHRYQPSVEQGWTENWVGFSGENSLISSANTLLSRTRPFFRVGNESGVMNLLAKVFDLVKSDMVGSEYLLSGTVMHLLGHLFTLLKRQELNINTRTDEIIVTAKSLMERQFSGKVSLEEIAAHLNISYAWFRKYFKKNTGFSPYDYLLNIRISHARTLLKNSGRSVKEISHRCGFESQQQFSRTFRKKTGQTPLQFRHYTLNGH